MTVATFSASFGNVFILLFLVGIPCFGFYKKVPVYETFVQGAKEGFPVFLRIMPYMLAMLVAIGMLRASGAFDLLAKFLAPVLTKWGIPADVIPIAIIRPFSGSGATAALADVLQKNGGNTFPSHLAAMIASTTETTFYIVAIYFGAVAIQKNRHAIFVSVFVDLIGLLASVLLGLWIL